MVASMDVQEVRTHRSQILDRVAAGEEIVIVRAGQPVARLVPFTQKHEHRVPGAWRDRVEIMADFDTLPDDVARAFSGE